MKVKTSVNLSALHIWNLCSCYILKKHEGNLEETTQDTAGCEGDIPESPSCHPPTSFTCGQPGRRYWDAAWTLTFRPQEVYRMPLCFPDTLKVPVRKTKRAMKFLLWITVFQVTLFQSFLVCWVVIDIQYHVNLKQFRKLCLNPV